MEAFYFNIGGKLSLMVVPETRVYMDGHPILTHSYSIYKDGSANSRENILSKDEQKKQSHPNYLGSIEFEIPGRVFNYVADGQQSLSREEVEQAVEEISHYRDNPNMWKHLGN
jgi:hypothetical protein